MYLTDYLKNKFYDACARLSMPTAESYLGIGGIVIAQAMDGNMQNLALLATGITATGMCAIKEKQIRNMNESLEQRL
jgi:hypothetical protein